MPGPVVDHAVTIDLDANAIVRNRTKLVLARGQLDLGGRNRSKVIRAAAIARSAAAPNKIDLRQPAFFEHRTARYFAPFRRRLLRPGSLPAVKLDVPIGEQKQPVYCERLLLIRQFNCERKLVQAPVSGGDL